jgi:hypothetical protein
VGPDIGIGVYCNFYTLLSKYVSQMSKLILVEWDFSGTEEVIIINDWYY